MTPQELAAAGTEHAHQRALFAWANCAALYGVAFADRDEAYDMRTRDALRLIVGNPYPIPPLARLYAIHNQGHGDAIRGARAKAEGTKAGVPDVCLPYPLDGYAGLYVELKKKRAKDTSAKQDEWIDYLNSVGYQAVAVVGWLNARHAIVNYLWSQLPQGTIINPLR